MSHGSPYGTVLVVDDEEANLHMLSRLLKRQGYVVDLAPDGRSALVAAQRKPDVVLLDVLLPDIDGFEICRRLRANDVTRTTPIVFLTGLEDDELRLKCLNAGGDALLAKPIDVEALYAKVRSLMNQRRHSDSTVVSEG